MDKASPAVVARITAAMAPKLIPAGQALFLEGDEGHSVYLVADGVVDVLRNTGRGRAEKLAGLRTGSLFGTGALLLGKRRNASCVAHEEAWVYELDREAHDRLNGEAGRVWREVLMAALGFQIRKADGMIARLQGVADQRSEEDFKVLNQAAGTIAAFTATAVTIDDDESVEEPQSDNDDLLGA
jgi:CRP-like cAMP-binding protein